MATISLSALAPLFETASQALGAQTASIRVRLRRHTTSNPLAWDSAATVRVSIIETVDGREYLHSSQFTGGIRTRDSVQVTEATKTVSPIVQARTDGGRTTFRQNGKTYLQLTRIGETARTTYSCRVRFELLRGTAATLDLLAIETTEEVAPTIEYHRSVAVDAKNDAQDTSSDGVITLPIDPVSTSNLAAFVGGGNSSGGGGNLSSATYNGVAMTEKWDEIFGGVYAHSAYTLAGIPSGSVNAVHTVAGAPDEHAAGVIIFNGVDQTTPVGTAAFTTGDSTTASNTVTNGVFASGIVVDNLYCAASPTIGADQSLQADQDMGSVFWRQSTQLGSISPATMSWTLASDAWGHGAIAFRPHVTAAVTGTATASITESDVVAGGKTIIVTVTDDTVVPTSQTSTISFIANALGGTTTTTSFTLTLPTTAAGDLMILEFTHRGTDDGAFSGTFGGTFVKKHEQPYASSAFSGLMYYCRATGDHAGETVIVSSLTNSCAGILTVYRNVLASGDPFDGAATIVGEENASGNETQAEITTLVDGAMVCFTVVNAPDFAISSQTCTSPGALTERAERLSTGGTDTSVAHASAIKSAAGATGAFTWAQTDSASGSYAYALQPITTTPFADARAAMRDGVDSAQGASGTNWDSLKSTIMPVANVVRTSDTVVTITMAAAPTYDISAQEVLTWTIPASILAGGAAVVATPTFTIDPGAGPVFIAKKPNIITQAVTRASTY